MVGARRAAVKRGQAKGFCQRGRPDEARLRTRQARQRLMLRCAMLLQDDQSLVCPRNARAFSTSRGPAAPV